MKIETRLPSLLAILYFSVSLIFLKLIYSIKKRSTSPPPPLPPGPPAYPVVGSLPEMLSKKPAFQWMHNLMQKLNTEIVCIRLGGVHVIAVASPELSREFLKKHDAAFASRPDAVSARLISDGYSALILSPAGEQWKKMRRVMVSEVLTAGVFRRLHSTRREEADHLVRYVHSRRNGAVNVRDAARHYCANLIRKMVFGERFFGAGMDDGGPGNEEREHVDGLFTILSYVYGFAIADFVPWLEVFDLDGHKRIVSNAIKKVRKYQDPLINERMEMWQLGLKTQQDDILDLLINLKNESDEIKPLLSLREIKAQILEIMIATVDNPSNVAEWALAEMINQPDIFAKACEELDQIVGKNRLVQESDLPNLNYVKACVKEAFRLHPVAFNPPHVSSKDLVVGGYFIPKGSHVLLGRPAWGEILGFGTSHFVSSPSVTLLMSPRRWCLWIMNCTCYHSVWETRMSRHCAWFYHKHYASARLIQGFSWRPPLGMDNIDVVESGHDLTLAKPLIAHATPRLDSQIYL